MRIGAHVPVAGGLRTAVDYAVETGAETIQVFSRSPRRWVNPPRRPEEAASFIAAVAAADVGPVFTHASYLINLGATDDLQWELSCVTLAAELTEAALIGASGVVIHLGRRFSEVDDECVARIVETATRAFEIAGSPTVPLLLENSAGAGRQFGVDACELSMALSAVRSAGMPSAVCIDTCHAHAAGLDVRTDEGWSDLMGRLDGACGPGTVVLVHANDCKGARGSHTDRHEWIGDGMIGDRGFQAMMSQAGLRDVSVIVEMPGEAPFKDIENIRRLKRLRDDVAGSGGPGPATS